MNLNIVVSSVLLLMPLAVLAQPQSISGRIEFTGQIVDPGCEVGRVGAVNFADSQRLQVAPGVSLEVNSYSNACSYGAMPLSASFKPLAVAGASVVSAPDKGIVTITYW